MKKLITVLAVLSFTGGAVAQDWSHSGAWRLIFTNNAEADFNEAGGGDNNVKNWDQRTKLGLAVKATENMSANISLVHNAEWGQNSADQQYPSDTTTANGRNVLVVNEAYMSWNISDEWLARVGRGSFTVADGTVVAVNEWEPVQKAFDGAMFTYDHEMARLSLFGVQGADNTGAENETGEFWGFSADFKSLPEFLKMANLHYIIVKSEVPTAEEDSSRLGLTVKGDTAGVDYRATYAMYSGEEGTGTTTDIDASMMDLEVGYSLPDMMNLRVSLGYHTDSGDETGADNERYDGFHYDRHNNAGLMDIVGWGNVTYTRFGFTLDPREDLTVGADYYMFTATEETDSVNRPTGAVLAAANSEDEVGSELDLWVTKRYSSNFYINARYGMFTPGDRIGANADDNTLMYLEANLTF